MDPAAVPDAQGDVEKRSLRVGFVPLLDAAPLVIAKERGFFRRHGLDVTLVRQQAWSDVREELAAGALDAAQLSAPQLLAATLGLDDAALPLVTAVSLGLNGGAITVSADLARRMRELDPRALQQHPVPARALRCVLDDARGAGPPLMLAVEAARGAQAYLLRYWLASGGIDPEREVALCEIDVRAIPDALADGRVAGCCVGEPWGALAAHDGSGITLARSSDVWNSAPDHVLGVTREWADRHPRAHRALVAALLDAARWVDRDENRLETLHVLACESFVDAPTAVLERALAPCARGSADVEATTTFYRGAATFPWRSHAIWFLTQMLRWGHLSAPIDFVGIAGDVYRGDVHRAAAQDVDVPVPLIDVKDEGVHDRPWLLGAATTPIAMGPDAFLDGRQFDPDEPLRFVAAAPVDGAREGG